MRMTINTRAFEPAQLARTIGLALPEQGSIEIQQDAPGKEHAWHQHDTDETLLILSGGLTFLHEGGRTNCGPGDAIFLPAGTRHASVAQDGGAVYLIAFRAVDVA